MKRIIAVILLIILLPMGCFAKNNEKPTVFFDGKTIKKGNNVVHPVGRDLHIKIQKCEWVKHASFNFFVNYNGNENYVSYTFGLGTLSHDNVEICIPGFYLNNNKNCVSLYFFKKNSRTKTADMKLRFKIQLSGRLRAVKEKIQIKKSEKENEVNLEISDAAGIEYVAVRCLPSGLGTVYTPENDASIFYANTEIIKNSLLHKAYQNKHFSIQDDKLVLPISVNKNSKKKLQISIRRDEEWSEWSKAILVTPVK